jgi:hypothetical protein
MSTPRKNLAAMTAIFSAVGGALALTAGIHSMGATAATLAGASLAVPPIGMIVAGVAFMLFAAYLSLRVTRATKIDTFIEEQERAALQQAESDFIEDNTKQEKAALEKAESDFMAAGIAFEPFKLSYVTTRSTYDKWEDARKTSDYLLKQCKLCVSTNKMSQEELNLFEQFHTENTKLLEEARNDFIKAFTLKTRSTKSAFESTYKELIQREEEYSTALAAARAAYLNK